VWGKSQLALRAAIKGWIDKAIDRHQNTPWRGIHDEANFTCTWCDYYLFSGQRAVRDFLRGFRDAYLAWSKENEYHGFHADSTDSVTHTFENAEGFISALAEMEPEDPVNLTLIEDIAHHVGNWVPGIPAWYDWDKHMLVSHFLGTKEVNTNPPYEFISYNHSRVAVLTLRTYLATGDKKYLDWCDDWASFWVDVILKSTDRIPVIHFHQDIPIAERKRLIFARYQSETRYVDQYENWTGRSQKPMRFMLQLYSDSGNERLLEAVRRGIEIIEKVDGLGAVLAIMEMYQRVSGDTRYQEHIDRWYTQKLLPMLEKTEPLPDIVLLNGIWRKGKLRLVRDFGYRDANGRIVEHSGPYTGALLRGWRYTGDTSYLARAMELAGRRLELTARGIRDGRDHGCEGSLYTHGEGGRAAGALYGPAGRRIFRYFRADGSLGLEDGVAVIADPKAPADRPVLCFYNDNDAPRVVEVRAESASETIVSAATGGKAVTPAGGIVKVSIGPGKSAELAVNIESKGRRSFSPFVNTQYGID
jgi:hypothetical protein